MALHPDSIGAPYAVTCVTFPLFVLPLLPFSQKKQSSVFLLICTQVTRARSHSLYPVNPLILIQIVLNPDEIGAIQMQFPCPPLPPTVHRGGKDKTQNGPEAPHYRFTENQPYEKGNCGTIRFDATMPD